jgi:hypothetical protein
VAGEVLVAAGDIVGPEEPGHARHAEGAGEILEDPVGVDEPGDVQLAGPERGHLPVEDGGGGEAVVEHVADAGVAPGEDGGPLVDRPVGVEPGEGAFDQRGRQPVGGGEVVPSPGLGHPAAQRRVPRRVGHQEGEARLGLGDGVQAGQDVDGLVLEAALVGRVGVVQPVIPERVRHDVRRHPAIDPPHHEERRPDGSGVGLAPPDRRHRYVGQLADQPDHLVLAGQVVGREHGHVVGVRGHPGDQALAPGSAAVVPAGIEQQGLAGHAVRRRALQRLDAGIGTRRQPGGQPAFEIGAQPFPVARGALHPPNVR